MNAIETQIALVKLDKDIELLTDCKAHWFRLARGVQSKDEEPTAKDCALCGAYFKSCCRGCPIQEKTGRVSCGETPFDECYHAWQAGQTEIFQANAERMMDYLTAIRTELIGKRARLKGELLHICCESPNPVPAPVDRSSELLGKLTACQEANQFQFRKIRELETELHNLKLRELHATLATDDMRKRLFSVMATCNELRDQLARIKKAEADRVASYASTAQQDVNDMKVKVQPTVLSECCGAPMYRTNNCSTGWRCVSCSKILHPNGKTLR